MRRDQRQRPADGAGLSDSAKARTALRLAILLLPWTGLLALPDCRHESGSPGQHSEAPSRHLAPSATPVLTLSVPAQVEVTENPQTRTPVEPTTVPTPVPPAGQALSWPSSAQWVTSVTENGHSSPDYRFSMRRVGESPEFLFSTLLDGRRFKALVLGAGLFSWWDGSTLGLKYREISNDSRIPPPVFSDSFLSDWKGTNLGLETVDREAAVHLRGFLDGKTWDVWVLPTLELPPVRMENGGLVYSNRRLEKDVPLGADVFSPPAGVRFRDAQAEWHGLPVAQSEGLPSGHPVEVGGDVRPPVLVSKVEPRYPLKARAARVQGVVMIEGIVDIDGSVQDAQVVRSASPLLDDEALQAVLSWRYQPATIHGRPVPVYLTVTVSFHL